MSCRRAETRPWRDSCSAATSYPQWAVSISGGQRAGRGKSCRNGSCVRCVHNAMLRFRFMVEDEAAAAAFTEGAGTEAATHFPLLCCWRCILYDSWWLRDGVVGVEASLEDCEVCIAFKAAGNADRTVNLEMVDELVWL